MSQFVGDFEAKTDAKGRIAVPAAFKREFEAEQVASLIVSKDLYEHCLCIYTEAQWTAIISDLRSRLNLYDRQHVQLLREYQRYTARVDLDTVGRILIPRRLLALAGECKTVTLLGVGTHIELWDADSYASAAMQPENLAQLAQSILGNDVACL
ncbi:MAG: protein mraZ [Bacteroidales bacterium]|nr:protein mraZ [Bacteroidales bacterium]